LRAGARSEFTVLIRVQPDPFPVLRDPRTAWWEIAVRDFGPRIPLATWREPVSH
jgi:hypothetical protein